MGYSLFDVAANALEFFCAPHWKGPRRSARCTHCGALNTFPGPSSIEAFICSEYGESVVVNRAVQ